MDIAPTSGVLILSNGSFCFREELCSKIQKGYLQVGLVTAGVLLADFLGDPSGDFLISAVRTWERAATAAARCDPWPVETCFGAEVLPSDDGLNADVKAAKASALCLGPCPSDRSWAWNNGAYQILKLKSNVECFEFSKYTTFQTIMHHDIKLEGMAAKAEGINNWAHLETYHDKKGQMRDETRPNQYLNQLKRGGKEMQYQAEAKWKQKWLAIAANTDDKY